MNESRPQVAELSTPERHRQDYDILMRRVAGEAKAQDGQLLLDLTNLWLQMFEKRMG